jgi:NAD(P)-dependent dehydrogenase (short-subunit alcohol dehydrogenase family)
LKLGNRVTTVTGAGYKQGIGRAIALPLAREGADIVVNDINTYLVIKQLIFSATPA